MDAKKTTAGDNGKCTIGLVRCVSTALIHLSEQSLAEKTAMHSFSLRQLSFCRIIINEK